MTPFEQKLQNLIEPSLTGMGYELVRVQMRGTERKTLQIMAERADRRLMTLDDCETISKTLSAVLDVADPISDRYALEVSSPGIDRPLIKLDDFDRFKGFEAKVDLKELVGPRKHFSGRLDGVKDNMILMTLEKSEAVELPYELLHRAKLILTDALIDAHLKEQEQVETANQETN
jgi:ribosome maturation factor RimP